MAGPCAATRERPGRFSSAQIVDCETERAHPMERIQRHLEHRVGAQAVGVVAVLIAGRDHQHAKADHVGQAVSDLIRQSAGP